jgi:hypothetical protein
MEGVRCASVGIASVPRSDVVPRSVDAKANSSQMTELVSAERQVRESEHRAMCQHWNRMQ